MHGLLEDRQHLALHRAMVALRPGLQLRGKIVGYVLDRQIDRHPERLHFGANLGATGVPHNRSQQGRIVATGVAGDREWI
jgi:hypothetical protein